MVNSIFVPLCLRGELYLRAFVSLWLALSSCLCGELSYQPEKKMKKTLLLFTLFLFPGINPGYALNGRQNGRG
uniref:Uncharacterized protein n=1 Tax=Candidatus Kentrum sp. FM TaxID=2126340 RepID=A0A450VW00_9GAMM|nr:MAG: hypothetical protein BECKFM1743B_GA0114221_100901 [Candidatus Kentron sp. FM]